MSPINHGRGKVPTNCDALRIYQVAQSSLDQLGQVVRQMLMADIVKVVVIRILGHPPVEIGPC